MRRRAGALVVAAVAMVGALAAASVTASADVRKGSAGAPLTISLKDPNGTTTTTVTIAADGTYKSDFGISSFDDYTATVKKSDGTPLATMPFTVTRATEPCITPTAGTGTDWGVTHTPFPLDPRFPSFVTICGRVALATTGNPSTPAGSPPSLGTPGSVTRDGAASGDLGRSNSDNDNDDDSDFPWLLIVLVVVVIGVGVIVVYLWRRSRNDVVGSMYPDYDDDVGPMYPDYSDGAGPMYPDWYDDPPEPDAPAPPDPPDPGPDPPDPGPGDDPPEDPPPSSTPDVV
jgi:hypothetical protein